MSIASGNAGHRATCASNEARAGNLARPGGGWGSSASRGPTNSIQCRARRLNFFR
jgi:hypothetical protein